MTPRSNWAGTYEYRASAIIEPESVEEVQRLVRENERVRALGSRHSFNSLPDTPGVLLHLGRLPSDPVIDADARTITVGGATRYGVVAAALHAAGSALHNMGSLPHISVAGAIATGTHGSGDRNANLSSAVSALELVTADGSLRTIRRGDPGFEGVVVGLGAFGIVTRVTLDIQPTFDVRQDAFAELPWDRVLDDFDAITSSAYSVSLMTHWSTPTVEQLWLKTKVEKGVVAEVDATHLGAVAASASLFAAADGGESNLNPFGGVVGPWSERLPHFRLDREPSAGDEIQSEYMVPRENVREAIVAMRAIGERIDDVLLITELRTMAGDEQWLSPAQGRDSVGVHFTFTRDQAGVDAVLPAIEEALLPLGARPHWGKRFLARAADIAPLYPHLDEWRALRSEWDPSGRFASDFLRERLLG
ncbi:MULTISPECIES: D-arabinono-1,4-lactone oxidase [unclassified Rathayibacter]|uniref:D-arabinono-1,4-lactone oxidase n=1 Tax=unclassified Rathayibacter TaxID=2609250 RepID=UPI00188C2313|nr:MULTISPECIES: D-arabinono-1,4-lactone oxidase [unclassified Rathayibacter]MBF4463079.1 FAD-binding protein [Rathayibacter sp. VKM Ac-2879]MBF4504684.1 FAD-binding protein [Rathayibacter sp. VKM Ac-2878]